MMIGTARRRSQRLCHDLLALKAKQEDEGREQGDERERLQPLQEAIERRLRRPGKNLPAQHLRQDHGDDDVEADREDQRRPKAR